MRHRKYLYGPGRANYVSEFTRFIDNYLQAHPEVRQDQQLGWRIWWERPFDPAAIEQSLLDELSHPAYHSYYYE